MSYTVVPIPERISANVRQTLVSPHYSHPASIEFATGYGPCRSCLKTFQTGKDERILFTYNSFDGLFDLPLPVPIFVHKEPCESYAGEIFPPDLIDLPLLLEGFGDDSELIKRVKFDKENVDSPIEDLFGFNNLRFINIRNAEAGCFIARIDKK